MRSFFLYISTAYSLYQDGHIHNELKAKYTNQDLILFLLVILCVCLITYLVIIKYRKTSFKNDKEDSLRLLTPKEIQVYKFILEHKTNKEIALLLFISNATVKTHINNIYRKLNIKSRKELISFDKD